MKRLYEVQASGTLFVWGDDEFDAEREARDALRDGAEEVDLTADEIDMGQIAVGYRHRLDERAWGDPDEDYTDLTLGQIAERWAERQDEHEHPRAIDEEVS